jgi:amidase
LSRRRGLLALAGFALALRVAAPWANEKEAPAADTPLSDASLAQLEAALASGTLSSVELTVAHLNRVLAYDRRGPKLNSIPLINPRALEEAARADALRRLGVELGPLQGVPFVVKDSYKVAGMPTSVGVAGWKALVPPDDAFIVSQMRRAGAVLLGKANLDTFASNSEGISEAFGAVRNPYGAKAVGGSSAGSAVAVAAGLAPISFGGDTAGSLRMPASRNAVVSLRPTLGLISTDGTAPGDPLFDVVGPMTRSVRDLAVVLDVVVADDPHDALATVLPGFAGRKAQKYALASPPRSLRGITFGVPRRLTGLESRAPEVLTPGKPILEAFSGVRARLEAAGARVIDVDVPADEVLDDTWYYDGDVSSAGPAARPMYDARVALVNIKAFAHEFERFCRGWCGDPADRMLDVAALFDYPEFMQAFNVLREGSALALTSKPVVAALRNAAEIADGPLFAQWMKKEGIDALLFPASSDADSDTRFGLNYLSELGAPGLFVPAADVAGTPAGIRQPLGVALVAGRFEERRLLELGDALEHVLRARRGPASTPALPDEIGGALPVSTPPRSRKDKTPPVVSIDTIAPTTAAVGLQITGSADDSTAITDLRVYVNGAKVSVVRRGTRWKAIFAADADADTDADALCAADGMVIAFAKDAAGNAAAAHTSLVRMPGCPGDTRD